MKTHELKCWPMFFSAMMRGDKTFEARKNDRDYQMGDILWLREWVPADGLHSALGEYTGRELWYRVSYLLKGSESNNQTGIIEGFVVMGVKRINRKK